MTRGVNDVVPDANIVEVCRSLRHGKNAHHPQMIAVLCNCIQALVRPYWKPTLACSSTPPVFEQSSRELVTIGAEHSDFRAPITLKDLGTFIDNFPVHCRNAARATIKESPRILLKTRRQTAHIRKTRDHYTASVHSTLWDIMSNTRRFRISPIHFDLIRSQWVPREKIVLRE